MEPVNSKCDANFSDPENFKMTALEYFRYFFDESLISHISYQTNLYSMEKTGKSVNTNEDEIEQFLGIHILSGIVKMPSYRMYWAEATCYSPIANVMARNRFNNLRNFRHICWTFKNVDKGLFKP